MATKTFNIGEYAVGGRIKVTIQGDVLTIDALSWTTKQLVSGQTFQKKTDWDGKTHFEGRPIDNFLNDLTSSYYAGKIMDWIKEKTEVKFAQGGNIDRDIKAKPRGWRFSGEDNYKRPTPSERGTRGTYFEARRNRSDKDLRKRLEEGGKTKETDVIGNWEQTFIAHKKYPATITEKVEELEEKDEELEGNIQDKADEYESEVSDLESRIEDMEGKVSDLEDNMPEMAKGGSMAKGGGAGKGKEWNPTHPQIIEWLESNPQFPAKYKQDGNPSEETYESAIKEMKFLKRTGKLKLSSGGSMATGGEVDEKLTDQQKIILRYAKDGNKTLAEISSDGGIPMQDIKIIFNSLRLKDYFFGKEKYRIEMGYDGKIFLSMPPKKSNTIYQFTGEPYSSGGSMAEGGETENLKLSKLLKDLENAEENVSDWEQSLLQESRGDYEPGDLPSRSDIKDYIEDAEYEVRRIESEINRIKSTGSMARGGKTKTAKRGIPNHYKGRHFGKVWDLWTPKQRRHFLLDHLQTYPHNESGIITAENSSFDTIWDVSHSKDHIKDGINYQTIYNELVHHIREGQYAKGGIIGELNKTYSFFDLFK